MHGARRIKISGILVLTLFAVFFVLPAACDGGSDDSSDTVAASDDDDLSTDDDTADDDAPDDDTSDDDTSDDDTSDDDTSDDDTADDDTCSPLYGDVLIYAHRGARTEAPENTIPAIDAAFDLGADVVEMDVRDTSDGAFVLMHDDTVDRTTDGTGLVSDLTLAQIKSLEVNDGGYDDGFPGLRVPTLNEALAQVKTRGGRAYLDMKTDKAAEAMQIAIDMGLADRVFVYSGDWSKLDAVRALWPSAAILPPTSSVEQTNAILDHFDPDPTHFEVTEDGFTPENLAAIDALGAFMTMDALGIRDIKGRAGNTQAWLEMMEAGMDMIGTDFCEILVDFRDSLCEETTTR
ncbi:MAG: glycerophosphodiester phosphodiesterase family protein [Deltaproteobacteria bacterium]|nr:glycerophosphodiester phosphodiesterase family protein [Deltaproteobacteria bacterium]